MLDNPVYETVPPVSGHPGIVDAVRRQGTIQVIWENGYANEFHFLWLRDNCGCAACRHPKTLERTFDLLSVAEDLDADSVSVTGGELRIVWSGGGHVSLYPADWLRSRGAAATSIERHSQFVSWDARLRNRLPSARYERAMGSDRELHRWLSALRDLGIALMRGVPAAPGHLLRVAERIGYPRPTNFATLFDVVASNEPNSNAYTSLPLPSHTDLPYYELPPGFQFLFCLANGAEGGQSVVVDGFAIAERLRRDDEKAFELLSRTPVMFRFTDSASDYSATSPVIATDGAGRVTEIRFNTAVTEPFQVPVDRMDAFYRAYRKFMALSRDDGLRVRLRLSAGDLMVFDNRRVLHGRDGFRPGTGHRHLQGCYVDHDQVFNRIRVLEREIGEAGQVRRNGERVDQATDIRI